MMEVTIARKGRELSIDPAVLNAKVGRHMVSSTQRKIRQGVTPANAPLTVAVKRGDRTLRDSGQLMASITYRSDAQKTVVGTNRIGARLQQFGGTVRAKNGKYLWIPAGAWTRKMQRRYGFKAGQVIAGLRADKWDVRIFSKGARGVCTARKNRTFRVVFVLKKQVRIPARPFLFIDDLDRKVIALMMSRMSKGD